MDSELENNEADAVDETFNEQAIEDAYLQALKASEEAGLSSSFGSPDVFENSSQENFLEESPSVEISEEANEPSFESFSQTPARPGFTPEQIIESLLFVGGEKLSARKISGILGSHSKEEAVREWIEKINEKYAQQHRPYEIQLGEDGYQLVLKAEFQTQRNQVFGVSPKEVRLSQDAVEVLSFIAYKQPVTKKQIEEIDQKNVQVSLRQLIRRELVAVSRPEESQDPEYHTTDRFLRLFGLNSLEELPRAEELSFK